MKPTDATFVPEYATSDMVRWVLTTTLHKEDLHTDERNRSAMIKINLFSRFKTKKIDSRQITGEKCQLDYWRKISDRIFQRYIR